MPDSIEGEATELLTQALDWAKQNEIDNPEETKKLTGKYAEFKPIELKEIRDDQFPPCWQNIMKGMVDGKKRALFMLIHLSRSIGMQKEEMEKKIEEWNKKNDPPLKQGYIKSQLEWAYRKKPIMPPNCKEFYQGIGVCQPDNFCSKIKNPVNYVARKNFGANSKGKNSNNFKNNK
jgi:DNA primase large subunit